MDPASVESLRAIPDSFQWLFSSENWTLVSTHVGTRFFAEPLQWTMTVGTVVLLLLLGARFRRIVDADGLATKKVRTDRLWRTTRALLLSCIIAATVPLVIFMLAVHLKADNPPSFVRAVGVGLEDVALLLFGFTVLSQLLRPGSVCIGHFNWPEPMVSALRRHLCWLGPVLAVCGFLVWAIEAQDNPVFHASLEIGRAHV